MLYTFGYQTLKPADLDWLIEKLGIQMVVDVRRMPRSRLPGWNLQQLQARFPTYRSVPGLGGGMADKPSHAGLIEWLKKESAKKNVAIFCMEQSPFDCHRHHEIAGPHFPKARHIYHDDEDKGYEIIEASAVTKSITTDSNDYEVIQVIGQR